MAIFLVPFLYSCASLPKPLTESERVSISQSGGRADLVNEMLLSLIPEKTDSVLIFKEDKIVLERYANGYNPGKLHDIRSATKAITSLLVGIAIDKGMIASVDQSILEYFPEQANRHPEFRAIRIRDLLTMSSGLNSDDWDSKSPGNEEKMYQKKSWVDFFFSLQVIDKPGEHFRYSTAGVIVLGELVKRASGIPFDQFADKYLFQELGIVDYSYARTPADEIDSGGHLKLNSQDFAKIGLLVLQKGNWHFTQIVSQAWVQKAIEPAILVTGGHRVGPYMGFLWWQHPVIKGEVLSFQARGNGGQYLIAVPGENLLVVFTGSAFNDDKQLLPLSLTEKLVIPAFRP
jgi:CubicO group peptidase (beta-lactamase class C family)